MDQKRLCTALSRTTLLALALMNQICFNMGYRILPIDDEFINELSTSIITVFSAFRVWWNDNRHWRERKREIKLTIETSHESNDCQK